MGQGYGVNSTIGLNRVPEAEEGDRALSGVCFLERLSLLPVAAIGVVSGKKAIGFFKQAIKSPFFDAIFREKITVIQKSGKRADRKCATAKSEQKNPIEAGSFST